VERGREGGMLEDVLPCKITLTINAMAGRLPVHIPLAVQGHMESWCKPISKHC